VTEKIKSVSRSKTAAFLFLVVVAVFVLRLPFILIDPAVTPDGQTYQTVADNIRENRCVSVSSPIGGACEPHWGGNQSPFYPTFIAAVNYLGAETTPLVLLIQALIYAISAGYLVRVIDRGPVGRSGAILVALILALSPVQIAWQRYGFLLSV
jgi:4-amino-4-deoxy-L-arabinose transferase-like glycosyltransferase